MSINEEYYVMVEDFSKSDNLIYMMGGYASNYSHILQKEVITQPVRYDINTLFWVKGRMPEDIIENSHGLIIKDKLMTEFFEPISPDRMMVHLTYFVSPDDDYFEGYWLLSTPDKPTNWLDFERSDIEYIENDDPKTGVDYVRKYYLNEALLKDIPLEKRQLFSWDAKDLGYTHQIIHKSWVDYLKKFDNRNVKFIPLLKFKSKMANQGPLPDFAI